ncbi:fungal fucose-specific lectin [Acephala macrosclerotiorum]|nr:fungal fucose-specific lectin [Acephala macrosclerotiorum]
MATGPVSQINFRTSLAACNDQAHLRVYSQAIYGGIRESIYEGSWSGGTSPIVTAKLDSPICVTSKGLKNIRLYYLSTDNKLCEYAYDSGKGWYQGSLTNSGFPVAAYSSISAAFLPGSSLQLRVYAQVADNSIQEFGFNSDGKGWQKMTNLGQALTGTSLATCSYSGPAGLSIRTYLQAPSLNLIEKAYDDGKSWYTGGFSVPNAVCRASLAVCAFNASSSGVSLRVYYSGKNDVLLEKAYDGSWYDGGFNQPCIPGSKVACIAWGSVQIRVYFQNGTHVTAVSEWCWNGGWVAGNGALPPA